MNRSDLVQAISNRDSIPQATVDKVVESFLEVVRMSVAVGEEVSLRGFGRFEQKTLLPTVRRAPKTGRLVDVPGRTSIRFVPAASLRRNLNNGH